VTGGGVRPDVVFTRRRVAIFVDGCYWHQCPEHGTSPHANSSYWGPKLERNVARDRDNDYRLREAGWSVIRVWEHEDPGAAAAAILRDLTR
jgi:DNA mismatch endonuclease (patch repair protein)